MYNSLLNAKQIDFDEILNVLKIYSEATASDFFQVRSVVVSPSSPPSWVHVRSVIRPVDENDGDAIVEMRNVRLLSHTFQSIGLQRSRDLKDQLTWWREKLHADAETSFGTNCYVERLPNRNRWSKYPCWQIGLREETEDLGSSYLPNGPFFHAGQNLFGETVGDICAEWLDDSIREQQNPTGNYSLIVPDQRAWIEAISVRNGRLNLRVGGSLKNEAGLYIAGIIKGFRDDFKRIILPVEEQVASGQLPILPKELTLYLLNGQEPVDRYEENPYRSSWGGSVLFPSAGSTGAAIAHLEEAMRSGEDDRVEFKSFIKARRSDNKSHEILKCCVAFANRFGGAIFVGVTDDGDPVGVRESLRKEYVKEAQGKERTMMEMYITDLRMMIAEGTDPSIKPDFEWVTFAGEPILRIQVGKGDFPHNVVASRQIFIRVGGTNRKMNHDDAIAFASERSSRTDFRPGVPRLFG